MSDTLVLEELKRKVERLQATVAALCVNFGVPVPPEE